ncbi:MAG: MFS transporter [Caedimonadaceae bacterium]|nr:MAG: MFS transporter [Caedimonadaceae bacterium]
MTNSISLKALSMWFCAALFYGFQFILRVSPGVMAEDLMINLGIDACALGTLISVYYIGYSGMQIPAGILIDKFGVRSPLSIACFLCLFGCIVFSLSDNLYFLAIGRFFIGVGSAFGLLSCIKIASIWIHPKYLTLFVGLALIVGTTGAVSGNYPLSLMIKAYDWRTVNIILGILSLVLGLLSWFIIADNREGEKSIHISKEPLLISLKEIVVKPQTWVFGIYGMMMYAPLSGFGDLWGIPFVMKVYNLDKTEASKALSYFYIGVGVGSPLWSLILTYLKSYKGTMVLSAVTAFLSMTYIIYYSPESYTIALVLYFMAGLACAGQFVAFGGVADINDRHRTATASGFHNMLCMISGVVLQPLIGKLLVISSCTNDVENNIVYSVKDFYFGLATMPIATFVAIVSVFFIKEVYNPYILKSK